VSLIKKLFFFFVLLTFTNVFCEENTFHSYEVGTPFIRNYPPREYKGFSQNWSIVQDKRGVMYIANGDGVLEYDGVNWRMIRITNNYIVTALAIDTGGVIYVGSINEFGFLAPDSKGVMRYHSLSEDVKDGFKDFGFINRFIISKNNDIFAHANNGIIKFNITENGIETTKLEGFYNVFYVNDKLYLCSNESGLNIYFGDTMHPVVGGAFFKDRTINVILEYDHEHLLISTADHGMFLINKIEIDNYFKRLSIQKFSTQIEYFLDINRFNFALKLHNGNFAFASARAGTVIIDKHGKIVQILNKSTGIYNDTHYSLFQDSENAIWLALDNGISKAEINSPLSFWNDATGLKGSVLAITRFNNILYVGTWQGVFYLDLQGPANAYKQHKQLDPIFFNPLEGINNTAWDFLEITDDKAENVLLVATSDGIYCLAKDTLSFIYEGVVNRMYRLKNPDNIILLGTDNGAVAIKMLVNNGRISFETLHRVHGSAKRIISFGQTKGGNIWLGTQYRGVMLLQKNTEPNDTLPFNYTAKAFETYRDYPIGGSVYIGMYRDMLLFSCENGIFYFSDKDKSIKPLCKFTNGIIQNNAVVTIFKEKHNGNLLLQYSLINKGEKILAEIKFKNNGKIEIRSYPYKPIPPAEIWAILPEKNNITWLGGDEGLFRLNNNIDYFYQKPFQTLIRNVHLDGDSIYYGGNVCNINALFYSCSADNIADIAKREIDYRYNSVLFEYASLFFYDESQNKYQYQLIGFDKRISDWTTETKKEYTNLPKGKYVFEVRSKNIFDQLSDVARFEFEILAPWYRTYWAYFCYLIIIACFVYLIMKYSNKRLMEAKIRLENFVSERTAEIISQKRELEKEKEKSDRLLLNILPYKIAEELKEKGFAKAKYYERASVMFADFAGFTKIAEEMEPEELIMELNKCFVFFDEVCVRNNLEKIKTIGDSYMCAGGVPIKNNTNPIDIVVAGLEIIQFIENLNKEQEAKNMSKWQLRLGIHTGEIIAGVVGKKKFAYDIWGDTVNTASRMESSSELNKINISGATYNYIKELFACSYRGKIQAKHKGEIDMYFVERIKPEFSADEAGIMPNNLFKEKYNDIIAS